MFVPVQPFQLRLMFAGKVGAYPTEVPVRCSTLGLLPSLINIRLGWKGLTKTNTLDCYKNL